ncbi:two component transcriptional regulator AraC family [Hungatella hathewayi CAG:224]|nr:two component transcriptional regulator AraC family [Hungatella hathewayi CAG:224]
MKHQLQVFYVEFISYIIKKVNEYQLDNTLLFAETNPYDIFDQFNTLEEIEHSLTETMFTLQRLAKERRQALKQISLCKNIADYIRENYQHKISLQSIAESFAVSPSYLSRTFKKTQGVNIINFINQIRMEHAKEKILQGNTSLQEIALDVGIQNYNYFYLLFKETYGFTPSEYIKIVEQNSENIG